jgi:hypothetical protein
MKNLLVLIILLTPIVFAQNLEILHKFNVGKEFGGKNLPPVAYYTNYMPDDYLIDNENNIYISDVFNKRIYKYNKHFELLNTIEIKDPAFTGRSYYNDNVPNPMETQFVITLQCDKDDNLYVSITTERHFLTLLKYDKMGKLLKHISLNKILGYRDITGFNVNYWNGIIYMSTLPLFSGDHNDFIFVFNQEGDLLGKVDYYLMGSDSNIYQTDRGKNYFQVIKYKFDNKYSPSGSLNEINKIRVDKKEPYNGMMYPFFGVDQNNNYYFGVDPDYNIEKFDFQQNKVTEIKIDKNILSGMKIKTNFDKIKVAPNGEIYWLGLEAKELSNRVNGVSIPKSNSNDVSFILFKITY